MAVRVQRSPRRSGWRAAASLASTGIRCLACRAVVGDHEVVVREAYEVGGVTAVVGDSTSARWSGQRARPRSELNDLEDGPSRFGHGLSVWRLVTDVDLGRETSRGGWASLMIQFGTTCAVVADPPTFPPTFKLAA